MTNEEILREFNLHKNLTDLEQEIVLMAMEKAVRINSTEGKTRKYKPINPVGNSKDRPLVVLNESNGYYFLVSDDKPIPCQTAIKIEDSLGEGTIATVTFHVLPGVEIK